MTIPIKTREELVNYLERLATLDIDHPETLSEIDQKVIDMIDMFPCRYWEPLHLDTLLQKIKEHNEAA